MKVLKSLLAAAAAAVIGVPMAAQAMPTLEILYDGNLVGTCADGDNGALPGQCVDGSPVAGSVVWVKQIGVFTLTVNTGLTKPAATFPELMDLSVSGTVANTDSVTHTLQVLFSDTQFSQGGLANGVYTNNNTSVAGTATAWYGAPNSLFDLGTKIGTTSAAPGGNAGSFQGLIASSPYSLTSSLLITALAGQTSSMSSDFRLTVPEPGTVALVSLALLGAGLVSRRRG